MWTRDPAPRHGRRTAVALLGAMACCACEQLPRELQPQWIYDEVTGKVDEQRERAPGQDLPYRNLASVPARPERPALAAREAISKALIEDRTRSRDPLAPRDEAAPPADSVAAGTPPVPAAPPAPARLAAAPAIPLTPLPRRGTQRVAEPAPPEPSEVPAPPPPDLLALPPPPAVGLSRRP